MVLKTPRRSYISIKAWRDANHLSQEQAAAALGMSQAQFSRVERGIHAPKRQLKRVAEVTGVPLEILVGIAS